MDSDTLKKREWPIPSEQTTSQNDSETLHQDAPPLSKRRKVETNAHSTNEQQDELVEVAKKKLSKWAARLFDPDRPRGLVQAPKTIPLNDEFLKAFGKREKEFDNQVGRTMDIEQEIIEDDDNDENSNENEGNVVVAKKKLPIDGRKVRILNLAFTTSQANLEAACATFGPVEEANLLMDKERPQLNTGRAYVTFESPDSAEACIQLLTTLDGRSLRVAMAPPEAKRARRSTGGARYWAQDISVKCFRCGQVGHYESDCPNAALIKPCPLCGGVDHDMRACPKSRVCFRCGVPGHVNRECSYRQNLPKRVVCSICFQSGHHRCNCRQGATNAPSHDAKCFVCQSSNGHFQCREMKWFFGLDSVSCFNCGRTGHLGYDCDRPIIDVCARDDNLADREIERATAMSLADEMEQQQSRRRRGRDDRRGYDGRYAGGGERSRAHSQPPPRQQIRSSRDNGGRDSGRGYPPQQQQQRRPNNGGKQRGYLTSRRDRR